MSRQNNAYVSDNFSPTAPSVFDISSAVERVDAVQNDEQSSMPPIYTQQTIITVQPQGVPDGSRSSRRPIPVNTTDWVSTPRNQLNALVGTDFLLGIEQLEIQQTVELSTLLGETKPGNKYRIKVPRAETIFLATEESYQFQQGILGSSRAFTLSLMDPTGQVAFIFRKSLSWGCLPGFLHKMTVECFEPIGSIEQRFTLLAPHFTIYDASKTPLCHIYGPNLWCCCMNTDIQFQVISNDGTHQVASLIHQWDHILVDYTLTLTFPSNTNVTLKGLLLGAAFLMENLYFARVKKSQHP